MEVNQYLTYKNTGSVTLSKNKDGSYDITYKKDKATKAQTDTIKIEDLKNQKASLIALLDNINTLISDVEALG